MRGVKYCRYYSGATEVEAAGLKCREVINDNDSRAVIYNGVKIDEKGS